MMLLFGFVEARLFTVATDSELADSAARQGRREIEIYCERPDFFYDDGQRITGTELREYAVIIPTEAALRTASAYVSEQAEDDGTKLPYIAALSDSAGLAPFRTVGVRERYTADHPAVHLLGYLGYDGEGVSGLERAFQDYLDGATSRTSIAVEVDALGRNVYTMSTPIVETGGEGEGVTLTLSRQVQQACEFVADEFLTRGAIVVLECETGEIKGMVSRPDFDPTDVADSLEREGSPLLNRALCAYNVGSVYKPLVAAAALEAGFSPYYYYECEGFVETDSGTYTCNNAAVHGPLYLEGALCDSCNVYFISLGRSLGAEGLYSMARSAGLGRETVLWDSFSGDGGYVPTVEELQSESELINHCFGQGKLLATPLQIAAMTNCFATGGLYVEPSLIKRVGGDEIALQPPVRIMSQDTAQTVADCLAEVVQSGTGKNAKPYLTTAAGKTGTAQTGRSGEDGAECIIGWFTGFFPADEPRYTVAVMTEDDGYGYTTAASAAGALADLITALCAQEG